MNLWADKSEPKDGYIQCISFRDAKRPLDLNHVVNIYTNDIEIAKYIEKQAELGLIKAIRWKTDNEKVAFLLKSADMFWSSM